MPEGQLASAPAQGFHSGGRAGFKPETLTNKFLKTRPFMDLSA